MKHTFMKRCTLLAALCVGTLACTDVELCQNEFHPHIGEVRLRLHWGDIPQEDIPEELNVVASRVFNTWRAHGLADTGKNPDIESNVVLIQTTTELPDYSSHPEEPETPEIPEIPETRESADGEIELSPNQPDNQGEEPKPIADVFRLRSGEYNIFVVNEQKVNPETQPEPEPAPQPQQKPQFLARTEAAEGEQPSEPIPEPNPEPESIPQKSAIEIENLETYISDQSVKVNNLFLQIKSMGKKKPALITKNDLPDFNPQYEYLEDITSPIFHGLTRNVHIRNGELDVVDIDMQRMSQRINIHFYIQTDGLLKKEDISEPIMEVSGICGRFNITESYVDTTKLYRMAHQVLPQDFTIEPAAPNTYKCVAHFHTMGIIPSSDKNYLSGPGIIQIAVRISRTDPNAPPAPEGEEPAKLSRWIYAGLNPYEELHAASKLVERDGKNYFDYSTEDVDIVIQTPLIIKADQIVPDDNGMGWIPSDPTDPDGGNTDIEI